MKAKKFISAVSALVMTASAMATCVSVSAAGEDVILSGDQIECKAGAKFSLSVNLAELNGEAGQGFSGCEFAIEYDPSMITIDEVAEGAVLKNTNATAAELETSPNIGDEVTMVNKQEYNCFDYNVVKGDGKNTIALLWCTGLESTKYWAKTEGKLLTLNGTVSKDVKADTKIPVKIVPISRDGNEDIIFGYVNGTTDKVYSAAVAQDGLITVVANPPADDDYTKYTPLWGDVNDDGSVSAADLVAMIRYMLDPEEAAVTRQGQVNGNLDQADGNTEFDSPDILGAYDLVLLKKLLVEDITDEIFPVTSR